MAFNEFPKFPEENFTIEWDFTGKLPIGSTSISTVTGKAYKFHPNQRDKLEDVTATIIASDTNDGLKAQVTVQGGSDEFEYVIKAIVTFDDGSIRVAHAIMKVRNNVA